MQKRGERRAREASAPTGRKGLPADVAEEAVAVMLGAPADRVYAVLRTKSEARVVSHARRRAAEAGPAELADGVVERYVAGASGKAIAASLGLGEARVYRLLLERTLSDGSGVMRSRSEASSLREERRRRPG